MSAAAVTPVDNPAGTLRRAAEHLRTLADAAVPGPWAAVQDDAHGWTVGVNPHSPVLGVARIPDCAGAGGDARYIAAMHPSVGLLLADLFVEVAENVRQNRDTLLSATDVATHVLALVILGEQR